MRSAESPAVGSGIAAVGRARPAGQWGQRAHSARPTRYQKSSTVAVITGSGCGTDKACRARDSCISFAAGANRP